MAEDHGDTDMTPREIIFREVDRERSTQDALWGGPEWDDEHSEDGWIALLCRHIGLAVEDGLAENESRFRKQMVRVAALAVAALESYDRLHKEDKPAGPISTGSGW
jgi:hypothetical protein